MEFVVDAVDLNDKLLHYPIYDTFYIFDLCGEELPVLRQKYMEVDGQDVVQLSLVVLEGRPTIPLGKDSLIMVVKQVLRGEDECVIESTSVSVKELCEKYYWFLED